MRDCQEAPIKRSAAHELLWDEDRRADDLFPLAKRVAATRTH